MIVSRLPRFYSYHKSVSLETTYFEGKTDDTCQLCKKDKRTGKDFFFLFRRAKRTRHENV